MLLTKITKYFEDLAFKFYKYIQKELHAFEVYKTIEEAKPEIKKSEEMLEKQKSYYNSHDGKNKGETYKSGDEIYQILLPSFKLQDFYNDRKTTPEQRKLILQVLLPEVNATANIMPPLHIDFPNKISMGEGSFIHFNSSILDIAKVDIGKNTLIGPNFSLYTSGHPIETSDRDKYILANHPTKIGDRVWIGGSVTMIGGVTIGDNSIIGTGAKITKDVPEGVIVVGENRILRNLTPEELSLDSSEKEIIIKNEINNSNKSKIDFMPSRQSKSLKTDNVLKEKSNSLIKNLESTKRNTSLNDVDRLG